MLAGSQFQALWLSSNLLGLKSAKFAKASPAFPVELVELAKGSALANGSELKFAAKLSADGLLGLGLGDGRDFGGAGLGGGCFLCFGGNTGVGDSVLPDDFGANGSLSNKFPT